MHTKKAKFSSWGHLPTPATGLSTGSLSFIFVTVIHNLVNIVFKPEFNFFVREKKVSLFGRF